MFTQSLKPRHVNSTYGISRMSFVFSHPCLWDKQAIVFCQSALSTLTVSLSERIGEAEVLQIRKAESATDPSPTLKQNPSNAEI